MHVSAPHDSTKDGKTHVYWQLVCSVRHGRKVVQETVAQLGELDAQGRARATALARSIAGRSAAVDSQRHLFEADDGLEPVAVDLEKVRLERSRGFGAVWLGWTLWRALKLDELCAAIACRRVGRVCHGPTMVAIACHRAAMRALERIARGRAAGIGPRRWKICCRFAAEGVYDERLYRTLDRLLPHKEAIEQHSGQALRRVVRSRLRSAAL